MLESTEDALLVRKALEGQESAFAALIDRYRRIVFGLAWSTLQDYDDVEDATQEVFVRAYRRLGDLRDPDKFAAWLYTIATNIIRKRLRERELLRTRVLRLDDLPEQDASRLKPDSEYEQYERAASVALRDLPSGDRTVTTLFYLVGLDQQNIARMLDIPVGTVKSRLHRSRRTLKRRILTMAKTGFEDKSRRDDYGRAVIGGMRGVIHWEKLLRGEELEGWRIWNSLEPGEGRLSERWKRSGESIIGEHTGEDGDTGLVIGDERWQNYEFSVLITPLAGGNAQVLFRVSNDDRRYYLFDMMLGWQALSVTKVDLDTDPRLERLSVVNFPLEIGQEYDVLIAARGRSITTYVDGRLMNQVTDRAYRSGSVALNVWQSKTAFRDPRIRHLH